jgi:hypothetical protein
MSLISWIHPRGSKTQTIIEGQATCCLHKVTQKQDPSIAGHNQQWIDGSLLIESIDTIGFIFH